MAIPIDSIITSLLLTSLGTFISMVMGRRAMLVVCIAALILLVRFRSELVKTPYFESRSERADAAYRRFRERQEPDTEAPYRRYSEKGGYPGPDYIRDREMREPIVEYN